MSIKKVIEFLPELYATLLPEFFQNPVPREDLATCCSCFMCPRPGEQSEQQGKTYYSPETKCCTYFPTVPNYMVGAILSDENLAFKEGKRRLRKRIEKHDTIIPQGLMRPAEYTERFNQEYDNGFGVNTSLLCPYFTTSEGNCSIWKIKPPICATWFCRNVDGRYGYNFWTAVRGYLDYIENTLAYYALYKLNFDPHIIMAYSFGSKDNVPALHPGFEGQQTDYSKNSYESVWGKWTGKEEDLYIETFHIIKSLNSSDLDTITGIRHTLLMEQINKTYIVKMSFHRALTWYNTKRKI